MTLPISFSVFFFFFFFFVLHLTPNWLTLINVLRDLFFFFVCLLLHCCCIFSYHAYILDWTSHRIWFRWKCWVENLSWQQWSETSWNWHPLGDCQRRVNMHSDTTNLFSTFSFLFSFFHVLYTFFLSFIVGKDRRKPLLKCTQKENYFIYSDIQVINFCLCHNADDQLSFSLDRYKEGKKYNERDVKLYPFSSSKVFYHKEFSLSVSHSCAAICYDWGIWFPGI